MDEVARDSVVNCRRCGYSLRGLSERSRVCPECGQPLLKHHCSRENGLQTKRDLWAILLILTPHAFTATIWARADRSGNMPGGTIEAITSLCVVLLLAALSSCGGFLLIFRGMPVIRQWIASATLGFVVSLLLLTLTLLIVEVLRL